MRIALFRELPLDFPGGVTHVMTLLIDYLCNNGHEVLLFVPDAKAGSYHSAKVVSVASIPMPMFRGTGFRVVVPRARHIEDQLESFNPDLVHVLHPLTLGLVAVHCADTLGIASIASYHTQYHLYLPFYRLGWLKGPMWAYTRWLFNKFDIILSPSQSVAQMMAEGGIERVGIFDRGVDTHTFSPLWRRESWRRQFTGSDTGRKIVLYVGRLYRDKNIHAITRHLRSIPDAVFVFVGDGPLKKQLRRALPGGSVFFTGRLTGDELSIAFASSDIFLFPSKTEGCPNVVMEAVASGLPVVGIDSYGVRDIVNQGQCGMLYNPGDERTIPRLLASLVHGDTLRNRLSRNARTFAENKPWHRVFDNLMHHYRRAAVQGRTSGLIPLPAKNNRTSV